MDAPSSSDPGEAALNDERTQGAAISLQAQIRGFLAKRKYDQIPQARKDRSLRAFLAEERRRNAEERRRNSDNS